MGTVGSLWSKGKVNFTLEHATKAQRGSSRIALSVTSALDGVDGQRHAPAALPPWVLCEVRAGLKRLTVVIYWFI